MMTVEEAREWMDGNFGLRGCDIDIADGVTTDGEEYVDMTLSRNDWEGEIALTYWTSDGTFEIWGSPDGRRGWMEERNPSAAIDEVDFRIVLFDEAAEEAKGDMEANYISDSNREYGSIAVAW